MSKQTHTATPWHVAGETSREGGWSETRHICGHATERAAETVALVHGSRADADLIVRAVNSHEALGRALELAQSMIADMAAGWPSGELAMSPKGWAELAAEALKLAGRAPAD